LGRLESEDFNPTINRTFAIMLRRGEFLEVPEELNGEDLDIEYEGPLARIQKSSRLAALEQSLLLLGPMMDRDPELLAIFKENLEPDIMIRDVLQTAGAPSQWLKSVEARDAARQARLKQQEVERTMAMIEQGATAAGKGAPLLKVLQGGAAQQQPQEAEAVA
jgi:hypothetical protein